jgi:hypothetical protein
VVVNGLTFARVVNRLAIKGKSLNLEVAELIDTTLILWRACS